MSREKKKLRRGLFGYRKRDVLAYIDEIESRFEGTLTERADEITRLKGQNNALSAENTELYKKVTDYEREQAVISKAVISAQQRAEEIVRQAHSDAEEIIRKTNENLDDTREEIRELKAQMRTLKLSSVATLRKYESQLDKLASEDEDNI